MGRYLQNLGWPLVVCCLCGCPAARGPQPAAAPPAAQIPQPAQEKQAGAPFATIDDDFAKHELFRNLRFEELVKTIPDGAVDHVDFDATLASYALAKVTATSSGPASRFETTFRTGDGTTLKKEWQPAAGSPTGVATGLFMVPANVTSAATRLKTASSGN